MPIRMTDTQEQHQQYRWSPALLSKLHSITGPDGQDIPARLDEYPALFAWINADEAHGPGLAVRCADYHDGDRNPRLYPVAEIDGLDIGLALEDPETGLNDLDINPLTLGGRETLRRIASTGGPSADYASRWTGLMNSLHSEVERQLAKEDHEVPPRIACTTLCLRVAERSGEIDLPPGLDYDAVCRHAEARNLRRELFRMNGADPDTSMRRLGEILSDDLGSRLAAAPGSVFRAPVLSAAGSGTADAAESRHARANDALVRRLFAPLTSLPPEEITAAVGRKSEAEAVRAVLADAHADMGGRGRLDPAEDNWITAVAEEHRRTLDDSFGPAYRPRIDFHEIAGSDILLVEDDFSVALYSWPTEQRQTLFERDGAAAVPMVDRMHCPSAETIVDLRRQIDERRKALLRDTAEAEIIRDAEAASDDSPALG